MSARYTLFKINDFAERFHIPKLVEPIERHYNISPTQMAPVIVVRNGAPVLEHMKWGFVPQGAKDTNSVFRYKTYDAKSEGIFSKNIWRDAIRETRCLVPANGFYEWKSTDEGKRPFYITADQELFSFAGIYSSWTDPAGKEWGTFAIVTTEANDEMCAISDRMPVILQPEEEHTWLNPTASDINTLYDSMRPYDKPLRAHQVGFEVNNTKADNPKLIASI
ncbi:MAG: SOS response-associated peptidase [Candidatus Saccharibacteria bacterium]|nr:MAG: SOS response-associated peptidase [Candidatus Saccharibacteria bacterium]